MNPINEAWKYRIRKFQKRVLLIFMNTSCTFGLLFDSTIERPITKTTIRIKIADKATPSKLLKMVLFVIESSRNV